MIKDIQNNLRELQELVSKLSVDQYTKQHFELSQATIGQHLRHIIELYQCLLLQYPLDRVCYDHRNRDILIETQPEIAYQAIEVILNQLDKKDKKLSIEYEFLSKQTKSIESTYYRELLYNLEHSIHHQALIKVALNLMKIEVDENFGVAPSTIRYRNTISQ